MKERPILMNGEMVRAVLSDRKTQTRRLVKPQPIPGISEIEEIPLTDPYLGCVVCGHSGMWEDVHSCDLRWRCPYGQPGDRLWVRETWQADDTDPTFAYYRASEKRCSKWRPSIHMPRWASRITLEITAVRVERLRDISEEDAKAEGMKFHDGRPINHHGWRWDDAHGYVYPTCKSAFAALWQSINGPESWEANPWVWVIEFRRVTP